MQVRNASHSSSQACLVDKNTYSRCDWLRQTCYYSAHLTDGNAISKSVFMIRIYDKPLMTDLYFAAFYMTVTPLLASARKPPRYLWSHGISLTAVCQSSAAYDSSMWMNLSSTRNGFRAKHFVFNITNILIIKVQQWLLWTAKVLMGFCWIKILMQSLLFSVLAHHKSTVYSAFHHPVYPTRSDWTTTSPPTPFLPLSLSHHPSSSLKFCIPTWSMCNELAGLRQTLYPRVFTEREAQT